MNDNDKNKKLTLREKRFVDEYPVDFDTANAAARAGYKAKSVGSLKTIGSSVANNPRVAAAIEERVEELGKRAMITAERVMLEEARIAFADVRKLFSKNSIVSPQKLPGNVARAISSVEVIQKDGQFGATTYKYKFWDKGKALERISRHLGLYEKDHKQKGEALQNYMTEIQGKADSLLVNIGMASFSDEAEDDAEIVVEE